MSSSSSVGYIRKIQSVSSDSELKSVEMAGLEDDLPSGTGNLPLDQLSSEDEMVIEKGANDVFNEPELPKTAIMTPIEEENEADIDRMISKKLIF